mmetsp:Transcript_47044/g.98643  ORF Transcript_47044/g.98643 Transcript_47044/m.98643 type:complete len:202 (+) Transcript_47044:264-869(+)
MILIYQIPLLLLLIIHWGAVTVRVLAVFTTGALMIMNCINCHSFTISQLSQLKIGTLQTNQRHPRKTMIMTLSLPIAVLLGMTIMVMNMQQTTKRKRNNETFSPEPFINPSNSSKDAATIILYKSTTFTNSQAMKARPKLAASFGNVPYFIPRHTLARMPFTCDGLPSRVIESCLCLIGPSLIDMCWYTLSSMRFMSMNDG